MKTTRQRDLVAAALFIVVALLIVFVAIPYGVKEPKKVKFAALSPSYYPRIVSFCLLGFGIILFAQRALFNASSESLNTADTSSSDFSRLRLIWVIGILLFYYVTLPFLGFVLSSALVLLVLLLLAGEKSPAALVALPIALPLGLYFFFTKIASIPIPAGILEPLLVGL